MEEELKILEDNNEEEIITLNEEDNEEILTLESEESSKGSNNYNDLYNKPTLNGIVIEGNKQSIDYNIQDKMNSITNSDIENAFKDF